jgi:hypothetical protein
LQIRILNVQSVLCIRLVEMLLARFMVDFDDFLQKLLKSFLESLFSLLILNDKHLSLILE